jgi:hypothetical protein
VTRTVRIGLALGLVTLVGGVLWYILQPSSPYPARATLPQLAAEARIHWSPEGPATVNAQSDADALTALGYVHGMKRGWTVALWRRTALGTLGEWFGTGVVPIDRHARRLGFARHARAAYDNLSPGHQRRLAAYARGMNAALRSKATRSAPPFVLLDRTPTSWEPWHMLAVTRLLSWLGTPPITAQAPALSPLRRADRQLRHWLHLHGTQRSIAWAARGPSDSTTTLFHRQVLGRTALPVVQEVTLDRPGTPTVTVATLPGTVMAPTGTADGSAWATLLTSARRLQRIPVVDSSALTTRYTRLSPAGGDERLVRASQMNDALLVGAPSSPDTAWALRWPGLTSASDIPAWLRMLDLAPSSSPHPPLRLLRGDGLRVSPEGTWTVTGQPSVVERTGANGLLVGTSPWARNQAAHLRTLLDTKQTVRPGQWARQDSSTWASALLPRMLSSLPARPQADSITQSARTYLRNWDYIYESSSIGATIFEHWARRYQRRIDTLTRTARRPYFAALRRRRALRETVDTLRTAFGPDLRRWRWERVVPERRVVPVWSADSLVDQDLHDMSTTQYAPVQRPGHGHPSALEGGPSLVDPLPHGPAPTTWSGWTNPARTTLRARRFRFDPTSPMARSRLPDAAPTPVDLRAADAPHTTVLVPDE